MPSLPFEPDDFDQNRNPEEEPFGDGDSGFINERDWSADLNLFDPQTINENTDRLISAFHNICDELGCTPYNPLHKTSLDLQYASRLATKIRSSNNQKGLSFCYSRFNPEQGTCYLLLSFFDDRESSFFLPTSMMRDGSVDSHLWGQIRMISCEAFHLNNEIGGSALFLEFTLTDSSDSSPKDERPIKASSILCGASKAIAMEHVRFAAERIKQKQISGGYLIEPSILISQALSQISEKEKYILEVNDLQVLNSDEIIRITVNSLPDNEQRLATGANGHSANAPSNILLTDDILKVVYDFRVEEPLPSLVYPTLVDRREHGPY